MITADVLLNDAKTVLRLTNDAFNGEINDLINACKRDLELAGVDISRTNDDDPLLKRAALTYVKANFGYSDDSEKYQRQYDAQKLSLRESGDYRAVE